MKALASFLNHLTTFWLQLREALLIRKNAHAWLNFKHMLKFHCNQLDLSVCLSPVLNWVEFADRQNAKFCWDTVFHPQWVIFKFYNFIIL